jgi:hypothetical protein
VTTDVRAVGLRLATLGGDVDKNAKMKAMEGFGILESGFFSNRWFLVGLNPAGTAQIEADVNS